MKVRRTICIGCLLATLAAVATDSACASTLLSGYGGPGQGNQATLGSALLNGPKGGGNGRGGAAGAAGSTGSSSASAGSEPAAGSSPGSASAPGAAASGGRSSSGRGRGARAADGAKNRRADHGSGGTAQTGQASSSHHVETLSPSGLYPASERIPAGESSNALGVSGSDLLYIVLTLAVLACVATVTKRLAGPENVGRGS